MKKMEKMEKGLGCHKRHFSTTRIVSAPRGRSYSEDRVVEAAVLSEFVGRYVSPDELERGSDGEYRGRQYHTSDFEPVYESDRTSEAEISPRPTTQAEQPAQREQAESSQAVQGEEEVPSPREVSREEQAGQANDESAYEAEDESDRDSEVEPSQSENNRPSGDRGKRARSDDSYSDDDNKRPKLDDNNKCERRDDNNDCPTTPNDYDHDLPLPSIDIHPNNPIIDCYPIGDIHPINPNCYPI